LYEKEKYIGLKPCASRQKEGENLKKLLNRERIIALVCMMLCVLLWFSASAFPIPKLDPVGPAVMPKMIGGLGFIISVVHFIISTGPYEDSGKSKNGIRLSAFIGLIAVYLVLLPIIGYFFSTIPFLIAMTSFLDTRPLKEKIIPDVIFSVIFAVLMYVIFKVMLGVLLPTIFI